MELAMRFPDQCAEAIRIFEASGFQPPARQIRSVVVCGMGGSAAGGDFLRSVVEEAGTVPVTVVRDYHLPKSVGEDTWVVFLSYSGNTEETLSCYDEAGKTGAQRLCITSGGELTVRAMRDNVPVIAIPAGQPPRTALGYLFLPLLLAAQAAGITGPVDVSHLPMDLSALVHQFGPEISVAENGAKTIATHLFGRIPLIYGMGGYKGAVANRWKCQINENAKVHSFSASMPELCHNEIVGWTKASTQSRAFSVVFLMDGTESPQMTTRMNVVESLIKPVPVFAMRTEARDLVSRILSMCFLGDFISIYLAYLNEVDPEKIEAIDRLKAELAKLV